MCADLVSHHTQPRLVARHMLLAAMASFACGKNQAARVDGASAAGGVADAGGGASGGSGGSASGGSGGSAGSGGGGSASRGSGGSSGGGTGGRSAGGSGGRADGADSPLAQQGGGASGQGGDAGAGLGFSRCIEDWPTAGGPHPIKPSLPVEAGRVLWRKQFNGSTSGDLSDGGPVLSSDRLAFAAGAYVYFVNRDGSGEQGVRHHASGFYPSDLSRGSRWQRLLRDSGWPVLGECERPIALVSYYQPPRQYRRIRVRLPSGAGPRRCRVLRNVESDRNRPSGHRWQHGVVDVRAIEQWSSAEASRRRRQGVVRTGRREQNRCPGDR